MYGYLSFLLLCLFQPFFAAVWNLIELIDWLAKTENFFWFIESIGEIFFALDWVGIFVMRNGLIFFVVKKNLCWYGNGFWDLMTVADENNCCLVCYGLM